MRAMGENGILSTVESVEKVSLEAAARHCRLLEEGQILFFPQIPFEFPSEDVKFLLQQRQTQARYHKNIAYRPQEDRVTGTLRLRSEEAGRLLTVMRRYSQQVQQFLSGCLAPYASSWKLDYATFRPFQEKGREMRTRARNDLLHVDNFPTRPTNGDRILRFFTNISPTESRQWITTSPFETLVGKLAGTSHLPFPSPLIGWRRLRFTLLKSGQRLGLSFVARTPYDDFMLRMHHAMKEDKAFQETCHKTHLEFPPQSCWVVFTDGVPHAALSGQFALEQTFMIARESLLIPGKSPLNILQSLCHRGPFVDTAS